MFYSKLLGRWNTVTSTDARNHAPATGLKHLIRGCWLSLMFASLLFSTTSLAGLSDDLALAESLKEQGKLPQAMRVLQTARQNTPLKSKQHTLVMGMIANIYVLQRQYNEAYLILTDTQPYADRQQWWFIAGDQASFLANLFQRQQNPEKAIRWYEKTRSLTQKSGDERLYLQTQINLARLMIKQGLHTQARLVINDVLPRSTKTKTSGQDTHLNLSQLLLDFLPYANDEAAKYKAIIFQQLTNILHSQTPVSARLTSQAYGLLAALYQMENRYSEAINLLQKAVFSAQQMPDLLYKWEWELGIAYERTGQIQQAYKALERAVKNVESIRQDIPVDYVDGRSSFRQTLEPLYLALADILLSRASQSTDQDTKQHYLAEARETMELLKRSELEDYFDNRCVIESHQEIDLGKISSSTAAIYPIMFSDRLELLVSFDEHIEQRTIAVSSQDISQAATELASRFRSLDPGWQPLSQAFYRWLFMPVEDILVANQIDTLIYLPDGALRLVPMASLYSGEHFLIEQYSVVTSPGLTLFDATETEKDDLNILMAGLSSPGPVVDNVSERLYAAINVATDQNLQFNLQQNLDQRLAYPRERRERETTAGNTASFSNADSSSDPSQLSIVSKTDTSGSASDARNNLQLVNKRPGVTPIRPDVSAAQNDIHRKLRIVKKIALSDANKEEPGDSPLRIVAKHHSEQSLLMAQSRKRASNKPLRIIAKHDTQQSLLLAQSKRREANKPLRIIAKHDTQQSFLLAQTRKKAAQPALRIVARTASNAATSSSSGDIVNSNSIENLTGNESNSKNPSTLIARNTLIANNTLNPLRITKRSIPIDEELLKEIKANRIERLKQRLKLPGVDKEMANISALYDGDVLVNESFSKAEFIDELLHNRYDIIHIASHGVFGDSAENSFVMTYDELLDMNQLETLLSHEKFEKAPVELITLSACQTADGDDRAPLGISGIALRAKVRSALGALWAVSDAATVDLMSEFYKNLQKPGMTKAQALREAQITLLQQEQYRHPFFWSAFILIGNWL